MAATRTRVLAVALASGVIGAGAVAGLLYATGAAGNKTTVTSSVREVLRGGSDTSQALDASGRFRQTAQLLLQSAGLKGGE